VSGVFLRSPNIAILCESRIQRDHIRSLPPDRIANITNQPLFGSGTDSTICDDYIGLFNTRYVVAPKIFLLFSCSSIHHPPISSSYPNIPTSPLSPPLPPSLPPSHSAFPKTPVDTPPPRPQHLNRQIRPRTLVIGDITVLPPFYSMARTWKRVRELQFDSAWVDRPGLACEVLR